MNNFIAFDLECSKVLPSNEDWELHRPFGISCAAITDQDYNCSAFYGPSEEPDGLYTIDLPVSHALELAEYLIAVSRDESQRIVTWNGVAFDFKALCDLLQKDEPLAVKELLNIALSPRHIDIAFCILSMYGFMPSLDSATKGMTLGLKTDDENYNAPTQWRKGREAQDRVIDLCIHGTYLLGTLYKSISNLNKLRCIVPFNNLPQIFDLKTGLLSVADALHLDVPPTSARWEKRRFYGWIFDMLKQID